MQDKLMSSLGELAYLFTLSQDGRNLIWSVTGHLLRSEFAEKAQFVPPSFCASFSYAHTLSKVIVQEIDAWLLSS